MESDVCVFLQSRNVGNWLDAFRVEPCHPGRTPGPIRPALAGGTYLPEALLVETEGGLLPALCYIAPLDRRRRRRGPRLGTAARRLGAGWSDHRNQALAGRWRRRGAHGRMSCQTCV